MHFKLSSRVLFQTQWHLCQRRFCQTKIVKPIQESVQTATNATAENAHPLIAPSIFKYTAIPILGCCLLFSGGCFYIYNQSKSTLTPSQILQQQQLSSSLDAMRENSRNLLGDFERDWNNISMHISYWMYIKRIIHLIFNFSTVICSFPFVFISSNDHLFEWWLTRCVDAFEVSGVVFIKFGQWISCRPDLFGHEICFYLRKLCNCVETHCMKYNEQIIEKTFGMPMSDLFESFDPVVHKTSGSIAQVHKAKLHKNIVSKYDLAFDEVAVKIRHPNACNVQQIALDLNIIFGVSEMFKTFGNYLTKYAYYCTIPISYKEFEEIISRQCDLRYEAANMLLFYVNFQSDLLEKEEKNNKFNPNNQNVGTKNIKFPNILTAFCSEDVLMESWENGENVADILENAHQRGRGNLMKIDWAIDLGLEAFARMLFKHRLVHCDMHSGNLLVDEEKKKMIILDGGLCVYSPEKDVTLFVELLMDSLCGLGHNAANIILSLDEQYKEFMDLKNMKLQTLEDINCERFSDAMYECMKEELPTKELSEKAILLHKDLVKMFDEHETYLDFKQKWNSDKKNWENLKCDKFYELGTLINNLVMIVQRNGIRLRSDFCSLMLSVGVMEGMCKIVNPNQDLIERCWPFIEEVHGFDRIEHKFDSLGGRNSLLQKFGFL